MSDDHVFAEVDDAILCPVCDCWAMEWGVCVKCEQRVGLGCCTKDEAGDTICNECKEQ